MSIKKIPYAQIIEEIERTSHFSHNSNYAAKSSGNRLLDWAEKEIIQAADGNKHYTLIKVAYTLGGHIASGTIGENEAFNVCFDAICSRDIDDREAARKTIISGIREGQTKPLASNFQGYADSAYLQDKPNSKKEIKTDSKDEILALLKEAAINFNEDPPPPPVCLQVVQDGEEFILGTRGNFSLFIGKAKSRKTFFVTIALAAAINSNAVVSIVKGKLPADKNKVFYFDTEQGRYHVLKAARRVLKLSGIPYPENFQVFSLRKFETKQRLELIEKAIYSNSDLGLVVIDGVRDLVSSINDEEQATMLANKLLKWTEERDIHIICVLHQNKGDTNARGHLGSELQNKAETVLSITKDATNKDISVVSPEMTREREFEPFAFIIDENSLPSVIEDWEMKATSNTSASTKMPWTKWPAEFHQELLKRVFSSNAHPRYSQLTSQLKVALIEEGLKLGVNKVKELIKWYENHIYITKQGIARTSDCYYQFKPV